MIQVMSFFNLRNVLISISFISFSLNIAAKVELKDNSFATFYDWQNACSKLPNFDAFTKNSYQTSLTEKLLSDEFDIFFTKTKNYFDKLYWLNITKASTNLSEGFQAHVEKIILPNDAVVAIHTDLHGDIKAINKFVETAVNKGFVDKDNPFKIKNKNFYMLFLGDYVDRGWYGAEVIYTILRLKNENPDQVFMVRGNHEDVKLNGTYGFSKELKIKFDSNKLSSKINQFYNCLPVAIYLGCGMSGKYNIVQCCHGGIEIGFDPYKLLEDKHNHCAMQISTLMQRDNFEKLCCSQVDSFKKYFINGKSIDIYNGFMWNDFIVNSLENLKLSPRDDYQGTFFEYGRLATNKFLNVFSGKSYTLRAIFRGHQHGCHEMRNLIFNADKINHPDDIGVGKLWIKNSIHKQLPGLLDNIAVVTFSVAPNAGYEWPFYSFAQLHMAANYNDWRLNVIREDI